MSEETENVVGDVSETQGDSTPSSEPLSTDQIAELPQVQEAFAKAFGDDSMDSGTKADAGATRRRRASEQEEADELEGDELDDGTEPDGEPETKDAKPDDDSDEDETDDTDEAKLKEDAASTLSPLLRQAAKRAGWSDNEIEELHKANPDLAERTYGRLLKSANDLSAEYGRLGRMKSNGQQDSRPDQRSTRDPAPDGRSAVDELFGERARDLAEKYGDDFLKDIVAPMAEAAMKPVRALEAQAWEAQKEAVVGQVNTFFSEIPGEFQSLYGKTAATATEAQMEARKTLYLHADFIRKGARDSNVDMPVREALERANMMFAAEHMQEIERKKLLQQVQKRSAARTQRPSQRAGAGSASNRGDEAAMKAYAAKAAEIGFNVSDTE
jgi:hypothetical protein